MTVWSNDAPHVSLFFAGKVFFCLLSLDAEKKTHLDPHPPLPHLDPRDAHSHAGEDVDVGQQIRL